jgi:hypothetical protein
MWELGRKWCDKRGLHLVFAVQGQLVLVKSVHEIVHGCHIDYALIVKVTRDEGISGVVVFKGLHAKRVPSETAEFGEDGKDQLAPRAKDGETVAQVEHGTLVEGRVVVSPELVGHYVIMKLFLELPDPVAELLLLFVCNGGTEARFDVDFEPKHADADHRAGFFLGVLRKDYVRGGASPLCLLMGARYVAGGHLRQLLALAYACPGIKNDVACEDFDSAFSTVKKLGFGLRGPR